MIKRNDKDLLVFQSTDFTTMIGDMFMKCRDEIETDWVAGMLKNTIEVISDERLYQIEMEGEGV